MKDIRDKAKALMKGSCRVCKVCDGRVCAGEVPGMGGLGTGASFRNNVKALESTTWNMRLIHDAREPETAVTWLGMALAMPVVAAPIGGMFNFNDACTEQEYVHAVLAGSKKAGVIGCTGDGVPPPSSAAQGSKPSAAWAVTAYLLSNRGKAASWMKNLTWHWRPDAPP